MYFKTNSVVKASESYKNTSTQRKLVDITLHLRLFCGEFSSAACQEVVNSGDLKTGTSLRNRMGKRLTGKRSGEVTGA